MEGLHVLICEDEYLLASSMAEALQQRGIVICAIVAKAQAALDVMARADTRIDVAIVDVVLLDGNAFQLVRQLQSRGAGVVFCTGYRPADLPTEFAHVPCIGKPTDMGDLFDAIQRSKPSLLRTNDNHHEQPRR